jgi:methionine-rich copper-binding protein CopC
MAILLKSQRIAVSILVAGIALFAPISSASAHTDLVITSPIAGSDVNASQTTISLTFAEPMLIEGAAIVVVDSTGTTLDSPAPTQEGATLSIPWPADLTPGNVTVQWRASADDGHVLSGEFSFNYTAAAEGGIALNSSATPEATPILLGVDYVPEKSNNNLVIGIAIVSLVGLVAAGLFLRRSK